MRATAQTYTVTVRDAAAAQAVADRLAARGHRLVTVRRNVDSSIKPEFNGWWGTHSVLVDPAAAEVAEPVAEIRAVAAIARLYGGSAVGSYGSQAETVLRSFSSDGLVHELTQERSEAIRAALPAAEPSAAPDLPPGLEAGGDAGSEEELQLAVDVVTRARLDLETGEWDSVEELMYELDDLVMHQGSIYPWTADAAPMYAALATADGLSDRLAGDALMMLLQMAVAGRLRLAHLCDQLVSRGEPLVEYPDELACRAAVEAVRPELPAGRSELIDFLRGVLAAAGGAALPAELDEIAAKYPARRPAVALMRSLASGDLEAFEATRPDLADAWASPSAPAEYRALDRLVSLAIWELDQAR